MGTARNDQTAQQVHDRTPGSEQANANLAQARSNVYGLLAAVFRAEPNAEMLRQLKSEETANVLEGLGFPLANFLPEVPETQLAEDLAVEYARLFIGPGPHISLYESVNANTGEHSEAALWSERTVRVKAFIETAGLHYADDFSDLPDHASVELEFLQRLAAREAEALREGLGAEAKTLFNIQRKFLEEHLGAWLPVLCDKIAASTREPFYKTMADLAKAVVEFERELFDIDSAQP